MVVDDGLGAPNCPTDLRLKLVDGKALPGVRSLQLATESR